MLGISDAMRCASLYKREFIDKYYIITTNAGRTLKLVGKDRHFCHLIGIDKRECQLNHKSTTYYFNQLLTETPIIPNNVLPSNIRENSKKGRKMKNFDKLCDKLFKDAKTLCILYNSSLSSSHLNNVDYLFSNFVSGYSSGWKMDANTGEVVPITWIDESSGTLVDKEKYYNNQAIELIKLVEVYDSNRNLKIKKIKCKRNIIDYIKIFRTMKRNNMVLKISNKAKFLKFLGRLKIIKITL